jgi:hypothetical protein
MSAAAWDDVLPGERPASGADAKRGREPGLRCENTPDELNHSSQEMGGQVDAARSAARPAALPCQNSNNYPNSPYRIRKTAVTYKGMPGSATEVTSRVLTEGSGLDREGRQWIVGDDGQTWEQLGGGPTGAESKRAFALKQNLESFFKHYGRENSAFFTLSPLPGTTPKELARRFNDARKRELPWMRSYLRVLEPRRDGTAHHHLAVATQFDMRPDAFDWEAFRICQEQAPRRGKPPGPQFHEMRRRYAESATPELKACWKLNKEVCKKYGLGRSEMLPLRKCAEAVAHYVGAYLESGTHYRRRDWKGARRVEYDRKESLVWKSCGSALAFVSEGSREWRARVGELAKASCVQPDDMLGLRRTHGRSWAHDLRPTIMTAPYKQWQEFLWYMVDVYDGTMPPVRKLPTAREPVHALALFNLEPPIFQR